MSVDEGQKLGNKHKLLNMHAALVRQLLHHMPVAVLQVLFIVWVNHVIGCFQQWNQSVKRD
jgi:hypothetical protein